MFKRLHTKTTLRFRRWSRKSYAAFLSVGRHVTIGNLKNIVADTFLRKQTNTVLPVWKDEVVSEHEDEEQQPPPDIQELLLMMLLPPPAKPVYCGNTYKITKHNNPIMAGGNNAISHFYFKN